MNRRAQIALLLLVMAATVLVRVVVWPRFFPSDEVVQASPDDLRQAPDTGLPYVVKLGAPGCLHCQRMQLVWVSLAQRFTNRVRFYALDLAQYPEVAEKYEVMFIPTTVFFAAGGDRRHTQVGFLDEEGVVALMCEYGLTCDERNQTGEDTGCQTASMFALFLR